MIGKFTEQPLMYSSNKAKGFLGHVYNQKGFSNHADHGVRTFKIIYGAAAHLVDK